MYSNSYSSRNLVSDAVDYKDVPLLRLSAALSPPSTGSRNCRWRNQFNGDYMLASRSRHLTAEKHTGVMMVKRAPADQWRRLARGWLSTRRHLAAIDCPGKWTKITTLKTCERLSYSSRAVQYCKTILGHRRRGTALERRTSLDN